MGPANAQRFCWNQNALLKKIGFGNHGEITISWMVKLVTGLAPAPRGLRRSVAVWCRAARYHTAPPLDHDTASAAGRRLPGRMAGRKIASLR